MIGKYKSIVIRNNEDNATQQRNLFLRNDDRVQGTALANYHYDSYTCTLYTNPLQSANTETKYNTLLFYQYGFCLFFSFLCLSLHLQMLYYVHIAIISPS